MSHVIKRGDTTERDLRECAERWRADAERLREAADNVHPYLPRCDAEEALEEAIAAHEKLVEESNVNDSQRP